MELYEQIRREYEHGAGTVRAVARKLGVHRREVRRALANAMPQDRKKPQRERNPLTTLTLAVKKIPSRQSPSLARRILSRQLPT